MDIERFLGLSMSYVSHVVRLSLQRLHWILHRTWQSHWLWKMLTAMRQSIWELKENSFFIPSSLQKTFNLKTKFLVFLQCTGLVKCLCCSVWQETTSSFILLRCRTSLTSTQVNGLPSAPHRWTTHLMNAVCMGKLSAYRIYLQHWWHSRFVGECHKEESRLLLHGTWLSWVTAAAQRRPLNIAKKTRVGAHPSSPAGLQLAARCGVQGWGTPEFAALACVVQVMDQFLTSLVVIGTAITLKRTRVTGASDNVNYCKLHKRDVGLNEAVLSPWTSNYLGCITMPR